MKWQKIVLGRSQKSNISKKFNESFPPFVDFTDKFDYQRTKLSSSTKMMIKCWVKHIPTKVSYFQEEGQNYPHWRRLKEEFGNKHNPKDYESDDSVSLDEKAVKKSQ